MPRPDRARAISALSEVLKRDDDPFVGNAAATSALVLLTVFAWLSFIFLPVLIDQYVNAYGYSESMAGSLAGGEVGALTLVTLIVSRGIQRRDKRLLCTVGGVLVIGGNALSLAATEWEVLGLSRLVVGSGLGLVVAATNSLPALSKASERLYALGQFALCVFGCLLILGVPFAVGRAGSAGIYWLEAGTAVVALLCTKWLPPGRARPMPEERGRLHIDVMVMRAVGGACLFYIVQTALWAFAARAGERVGMTSDGIEAFLAASAICGAGGAALAIFLGTRLGIIAPLAIGFLSQAGFGVLLYSGRSKAEFAAAVLLITVSSTFVTPYLLTVAARLDPLGRVASAVGGFMNLGATIGPILAGAAAARFGFHWIGLGSAAVLAVGLGVIHAPAVDRAG